MVIHCSPDRQQAINVQKEADKENRISNIMQYDKGHQSVPYH